MFRTPRAEEAGAIHHVYARGNNRARIFCDRVDYEQYLRLLGIVVGRQRWHCLAYCLMPNHVHLLIETPEPNLGPGIQLLHGKYGRAFNDRHSRVGHVFQGRYGNVRVETDNQLAVVTAYIAANPVVARICRRLGGWPWSSHAATLGGDGAAWLAVDRLLAYLAVDGGNPRQRYLELLEWKLSLADEQPSSNGLTFT